MLNTPAIAGIREVVQSSNPLKACIKNALQGNVVGVRSLYWRVLVGLLPTPETTIDDEEHFLEDWEASMDMRRAEFTKRQNALRVDSPASSTTPAKKAKFGDSSSDDEDAAVDNPLSTAANSTYAQNYERTKLETTIEKDMGRLWSDDPFFEQEFVLKTIRNILLLYCEEESDLSYRQGMHELASFVVYILHQDAEAVLSMTAKPGEAHIKEMLDHVCSSSFLVADAYFIFRRLMDTPGLHLAHWYYVQEQSPKDNSEEAEITFVANLVQNTMLRNADHKLSKYLTDLNIHATSYGIRWLRLIFLREFSFSSCARLWDCMFADYAWTTLQKANRREYNVSQSVLPHIAVSMLLYVREELLQSDFSYALRRLMRYPPVEDINGFISRSVVRRYNNKELASLLPDYKPDPTPIVRQTSTTAQTRPNPILTASPTAATLPATLDAANAKQVALGESLAKVVASLDKKWFPPADLLEEDKAEVDEQYLIAIAELKRVRDVLLGFVAQ